MEICGRYHHWMPIIVYFMKRDLFFLWCTHFILLDENKMNFESTTHQFIQNTRLLTYDKNI